MTSSLVSSRPEWNCTPLRRFSLICLRRCSGPSFRRARLGLEVVVVGGQRVEHDPGAEASPGCSSGRRSTRGRRPAWRAGCRRASGWRPYSRSARRQESSGQREGARRGRCRLRGGRGGGSGRRGRARRGLARGEQGHRCTGTNQLEKTPATAELVHGGVLPPLPARTSAAGLTPVRCDPIRLAGAWPPVCLADPTARLVDGQRHILRPGWSRPTQRACGAGRRSKPGRPVVTGDSRRWRDWSAGPQRAAPDALLAAYPFAVTQLRLSTLRLGPLTTALIQPAVLRRPAIGFGPTSPPRRTCWDVLVGARQAAGHANLTVRSTLESRRLPQLALGKAAPKRGRLLAAGSKSTRSITGQFQDGVLVHPWEGERESALSRKPSMPQPRAQPRAGRFRRAT